MYGGREGRSVEFHDPDQNKLALGQSLPFISNGRTMRGLGTVFYLQFRAQRLSSFPILTEGEQQRLSRSLKRSKWVPEGNG